ncbi:YaaA family protein [Alkalispirochaeta alkalica]|uniref:YaaA family protein n=1 Tax=Alkalispirochaeta alkalica TaxID=46356 RepID=UPI000374821D|nr:YaaA family protein [Alkalispirochaeta alkalica]
MIVLLSPSKTQNFQDQPPLEDQSEPLFREEAREIMLHLQSFSPGDLARLMKMSDRLAGETAEKHRDWTAEETPRLQAIYAYTGEAYRSLDAPSLSRAELLHAQNHLRVLSGLYGLLRPLDAIRPYRLEMAAPLGPGGTKNLYHYWREKITALLTQERSPFVNLASLEYSRVITPEDLPGRFVTPLFKEDRGSSCSVVAVHAKRARGRMARWIITDRPERVEDLQSFCADGYRYRSDLSEPDQPVFVRTAPG